jgi:hypothetical protein
MRTIFILLFILISSLLFSQTEGQIRSRVTRQAEGYNCYETPPLDSVEIIAYIPGTTDTIHGIVDSPGLTIKLVPIGIYTVVAKAPHYVTAEFKGVIVGEKKTTYLCFEMTPVPVQNKSKKRKSKNKS